MCQSTGLSRRRLLQAAGVAAWLAICGGWSEDFVYAACLRPMAAERWSRAASNSR
jgi:hypothetical protein